MHIFSYKHNYLNANIISSWTSLVAQMVKNPPAMQETWIRSLGLEDPLLLLLSHFSRVRLCATP